MKKSNTASMGYHIYKSLTEKQLISLLDEIFSQMDEEMKRKILEKLDNDISTTLKSIFALQITPAEGEVIPTASDEKHIEEWNSLWKEWDSIVSQVGDDEGIYVDSGNEWGDPFFKGQDMMNDLEKIAEKMLPLINKLYILNVEKDGFFQLKLEELDKRIGDYSEYIITEFDCSPPVMGPSLTKAFLEWEWSVVRTGNLSVEEYLAHFLDLEWKFDKFLLPLSEYAEFIISLPDEYGRDIYEHINRNKDTDPWTEKLKVATFVWNDIYFTLASKFNPKHYLEMCEERFSEDWELGLPLFENYMKEEKYIEAEKTLEKLFEIWMGRDGRYPAAWRPEESLLAEYFRFKCGFYFCRVLELLTNWISLCEKLEMEQRKRALEIQLAVYEKPEAWDVALRLFKNLDNSASKGMASELFKSWQNFIFEETVSPLYTTEKEEEETWIHWLLSATFYEDKEWLKEKVLSWINSLPEFHEIFDSRQEVFYMFTADICDVTGIKKDYPRLFKFIIEGDYEKLRFTSNRRDVLRKMEPEQFIEPLLDWWRKHITKMVPDPSNAGGSKYKKHARMLSVVREFSNDDYLDILRGWKFKHKKKKSLWREIESLGLPVEGKW